MTWTQRISRLSRTLGTNIVADDEERQGRVLDEYLAAAYADADDRLSEVEMLRFNDADLVFIGKLAVGQFGTVDVVRCRLDSRVYARKTIDKRSALKAKGQCSPQIERDILVEALKKDTVWAPHILAAYQTETALKLVMQYVDGGNLWDVVESSPGGKISQFDLGWWSPQMVSAIEWCHSQGFVHRDIKPHNFVLTPTSQLLLIDFGSAAPLLPPSSSGIQLVPKEHCLVPCGTCDYISPEVLQCHEEALVALELDGENTPGKDSESIIGGYGKETDWWSFGVMLYEMAFGIAPFFANDVGHTYTKIIGHQTSLKFNAINDVSSELVSLCKGVLCAKEHRLGRHSVAEIKGHQFFDGIDWINLHLGPPPPNLHLPQFTYSAIARENLEAELESVVEDEGVAEPDTEEFTQPFVFSALFRSSKSASALSVSHMTPLRPSPTMKEALDAFIGFSWGPRLNAFRPPDFHPDLDQNVTPRPALHREPIKLSPLPTLPLRATDSLPLPQSAPPIHAFRTPVRDNTTSVARGHTLSIPRTGTTRRMQGHRPVTDREAMRQLVDCVGMSARKKVLESGKKPTHLQTGSGRIGSKKEIQRFIPVPKSLVIDTLRKGELSATSSESESQPPSPTPRPGSAMSRRSGWGRSTPSIITGRSTPTLIYTATATTRTGTGNSDIDSAVNLPHSSDNDSSFDKRLRDAEWRHSILLNDLASLEESIASMSLQLKQ